MKEKINITDEILINYIVGETDNKTNDEIIFWLKEKKENRKYFENLKKTWEISQNARELDNYNTDLALKKVKSRLKIENQNTESQKIRKILPILAIAASILIIIGIYFVINNKSSENNINNEIQLISQKSDNEIINLELPDKSIVIMNINSEISYPKDFKGDFREITFKGEAYFIISKNKSKPFLIYTENSKVEVVGTEFNIKANENEAEESIIVSKGKVIFSKTDKSEKVELTVGEKATLQKSENKIVKETNSDENFLAWKTGVLQFTNKSFNNVINSISDYYKVKIIIKNPEIEKMKITSTYDNLTIEEVMNTIGLTLNLEIEQNENTYYISK